MSADEQKNALVPSKGNVPANREQGLELLAQETTNDEFAQGDRLVPWLKIVQVTSDVKKRTNEAYVQGAEVGMIYDTLSRQMRDEIIISVVKYDGTHYTEFKPGGGKIVKQWFKDASRYEAARFPKPDVQVGRKITPDDNEISPAAMFYVLVLDPQTGYAEPMILSLGGLNAKVSRRLNSLAKQPLVQNGKAFIPAMYSRTFRLTTKVVQAGDSDNEVGIWQVEPFGLITDGDSGAGWLDLAKAVRKEADAGNLIAQPQQEVDETDDLAVEEAKQYDNARARGRGGKVTDVVSDEAPF